MLEDVSAIDVASIRDTTDKMRKSFEAELLTVKRCNVRDVKLPCGAGNLLRPLENTATLKEPQCRWSAV
jgi:hypothetical protein